MDDIKDQLLCEIGGKLWSSMLVLNQDERIRMFDRSRLPQVGDFVLEAFMGQMVKNGCDRCFGTLLEIDDSKEVYK